MSVVAGAPLSGVAEDHSFEGLGEQLLSTETDKYVAPASGASNGSQEWDHGFSFMLEEAFSTAGNAIGMKFRRTPEFHIQKRSQSESWKFPLRYGWKSPSPGKQRKVPSRALPELRCFQEGWDPFSSLSRRAFFRGPTRAYHRNPGNTEGISDYEDP